ncbi:MAG: metal-dependent transcriptional regulator [Clostridiaceae bacterium]|nr:metal-dependent transcriptional regulator [Clostridiales bacterium]MDD6877734.1 metal-dependent transcriptional regulator [Clostridiaceae bacterium]MDY3072414.1 metal-dependent transcriptional regulator [Eubacteriales bacterium]MDY3284986.1 metal-dependent transcriptional regulator [Eubacteriales bacterium]
MPLQESGEMYLESIVVLRARLGNVRAIDIANFTGYTKPSVSRALGLLKTEGFVTVDAAGHIALTPEGENVAGRIYERHQVLTRFFTALGVSPETAERDACRIEHVISDETFDMLCEHGKEILK